VPLIRNISDTARWAAIYRAREAERPNPLFRDPFARQLAGERGEQIARSMKHSEKNSWSWVTRTYLFDQIILSQIEAGCDLVINLAAGLDARPYRLRLPPGLKWVEVDLPEINEYKHTILQNERTLCRLERVDLDLADLDERRKLFQQLARQANRALIISEGLIIYLTDDEVRSLAFDLSAHETFQHWVLDLASPPLLRMLQKTIGKPLEEAAAPLQFGPAEGPEFFRSSGWKPVAERSMFHTAGKLKRLPLMLGLLCKIQRAEAFTAKRPWAGVCLLERDQESLIRAV
jgi:methyltransferase (TIGR00027 family)